MVRESERGGKVATYLILAMDEGKRNLLEDWALIEKPFHLDFICCHDSTS